MFCIGHDKNRKTEYLAPDARFSFWTNPNLFFLSLNLVGKSKDAATETRLSCRFEVEGVTTYEGLYLDY